MGFASQIDQAQSSAPSGSGKGQAPSQPTQSNISASQAPIQNNWGQSSGKGSASGAGINQAEPTPLDGVSDGYFSQPPTSPQTPQPMGKGGVQSNSATSGQPRMGQQNQYSNTVGQWDNTQQQPQSQFSGGKGKG